MLNRWRLILTISGLALIVSLSSVPAPKPVQAICGYEQGLNQMTVKTSGHSLYLLWESRVGGFSGNVNNYTLFFKKSSDDGMTFGPTINLYSTSLQPCFTLFSQMSVVKDSRGTDNVYVVWNGGAGMSFRASNDGGKTFGNTLIVGEGPLGTLFGPAVIDWGGQMVADSNGGIYVLSVSQYDRNSSKGVLFSRSIDGGKTFDTTSLGNSSNHHQTPQAAVSGSNVYLVWSEYSDCVGFEADNCKVRIIFDKSSDRGMTFGNATVLASGKRLSNSTSDRTSATCFGNFFCGIPSYARVKAVGSNVYVSWLYNDTQTYFTRSTDNGATFSAPVRISEKINLKDSNVYFESPFMDAYDGGRVEVGWVFNNGTVTSSLPGGYLELAVSKDWGSHFDQPHRLDLSEDFVISSDGTVYSVQTDLAPNASSEHIVFRIMSENQTAPKSTILASNSTQYPQWLPRLAVTESGKVCIIWQNASSLIPAGVLQPPLLLRTSSDGGVTFDGPREILQAMPIPEFGQLAITLVAAASITAAAVGMTRLMKR